MAIPELQHALLGQCSACVYACLPLSRHKTAGLGHCEYMPVFQRVQVCVGTIGGCWQLSANVSVTGCNTGVTKAVHR